MPKSLLYTIVQYTYNKTVDSVLLLTVTVVLFSKMIVIFQEGSTFFKRVVLFSRG